MLRLPMSLLLAFALAGCATEMLTDKDRALMAGRYAELETKAEAQVPDMRTAKTTKLAPLCLAYAKLKRYDKLNPCLDQLEKNVASGDTNMMDFEETKKQSPFLAGMAQLGSSMTGVSLDYDVTPQLWEVRAETAMDLGEPAKAVDYAQRMYGAIPKQWNLERYARIHALGELALAEALAGRKDDSLKHAQELEAVSTMYPYTLLKTDKLVFLARTYLALRDYEHAYGFASEDDNSVMRGIADLVSGGAGLQGGTLLAYQQIQRKFVRNKSALETGRWDEARTGYDQALNNPATQQNRDIYWIVLYDRGRIAEHDGKTDEALNYYRQAIEVIEEQRSSLNTEASKIGFVGSRQSVYRDAIRLLAASGRVAEAFEYVERSKSRALVDMLASKHDFAVPSGNAEQVRALLNMANSAEVTARALDAPDEPAQTRNLVVRARNALAEQAPELASLVSVTSLSVQEVQARLPASDALIEYYYGDESQPLYAFVVTHEAVRLQALDAHGLASEVRALRATVQDPSSGGQWRAPSRALYRRLMQPLEPLGKARITIVAHGALHYLPFDALHDDKGFLIERATIRMLPAASVLKFLGNGAAQKPGEVIAFGNPDLGDPRYDLAFAQAEAQTIAAHMPRSRALLRKDATKAALAKYGTGFRYIHIASHGEFDPDVPLQSGLLLAGKGVNDGLLTVGELYSMRLDADLVTLSACETALGKIANGDDVVGLTRGFLYGGARSIVASLWQVDDRATGELMSSFYDAIGKGADKREALRAAQLQTMKAYPHPFYWAAFEITGQGD